MALPRRSHQRRMEGGRDGQEGRLARAPALSPGPRRDRSPPLWPAITVCPGPFRVGDRAGPRRSRRSPPRRAPPRPSASKPITAAMAPCPHRHRGLHAFAPPADQVQGGGEVQSARRHQGRVLAEAVPGHDDRKVSGARFAPASATARWTAIEVARRAGWVLVVRPSSSSGPSKQSRESGKAERLVGPPRKSAGRPPRRRPRRGPMPTFCDPCPGEGEGDHPAEGLPAALLGRARRPALGRTIRGGEELLLLASGAPPPCRGSSGAGSAAENSTARRMAFWIAWAFERPWPMKQPPLTPRRGAAPVLAVVDPGPETIRRPGFARR